MVYIGANIYYWGESEQDRLLLDGLRRWALEVRRRRLARFFWFSRFDARGPHIFALFSASRRSEAKLRAFLEGEIRRFCLASPSSVALSANELERCHHECRGKFLCAPDRIEGLAPNNSFVVFRHEADGYPLWLGSGMNTAGKFWSRMDALTFWTLEKLAAGSLRATAVRWLAAVDRSLGCAGLAGEAYWRYHAASLIPALKQRSEATPYEMSGLLRRAIGDFNWNAFSRLWSEPDLDFDVAGLVKLIACNGSRTARQRLQVLREVTHVVLGRLVQNVENQIPMVLYAWQRRLSH
jgi:hypothetical protein